MMQQQIIHANAVAFCDRALLIVGPSGSGKSQLSLEMLANGASLVADDRVVLDRRDDGIWASCPSTIHGKIEARNIGILNVEAAGSTPGGRGSGSRTGGTGSIAPCPQHEDLGLRIALVSAPTISQFRTSILAISQMRSGGLAMAEPQGLLQRVVLVTGPSGAGRSSAVNALEDFGFEVIDNIPISLVPRLFESPINRPMAIGVDARNRDYSADGIIDLYRGLSRRPDLEVSLLYLDCSAEVLTRRYSETRRRHPMAPDESPSDGIDRELRMLDDVRACADILINTTELTVHELRASMAHWFGQTAGQGLAVSLHSFSFKRGMPQGLDMAIDCRFLRNPHWVADLRPLTGIDRKVAAHVKSDPRFEDFFQHVKSLLCFQLPAVVDEGKTHFTAGFGCTGGKHRSVMMVETVASALEDENWPVSIRHKELERMGMWSVASGLTQKPGVSGGVS